MTLYLTSDETNTDGENSRTNFKNRISADYFESQPFNLKLQEIFFDSKFPTLADIEFPHIITTIIGKEHKLEDFPSKFQNNLNFQFLCKNYKDTEKSPLLVEKQTIYDSHCSSSDCEVFYEIHPRLHFAFSIAFIKDITFYSQKDLVDFLNSCMFPFHKKKPLKYMPDGYVRIDSNLNIFISKSILSLLGITSFETYIGEKEINQCGISEKQIKLPSREEYSLLFHQDNLQSPIYSAYHNLIAQNPKGCIQVQFSIGEYTTQFEVEYKIELFHQRIVAFEYDKEIDLLNKLLLKAFLSEIEKNILNLNLSSSKEDKEDLNDFFNYLLQERRAMKGLEKWGGLLTLRRKQKNHILLEAFHTKKNKALRNAFYTTINQIPGSPLLKQASSDIFLSSRLLNISFNPTLCHLLGVSKSSSSFFNLQMDGKESILFPFPLNYYKTIRHEIIHWTPSMQNFFALQLILIEESHSSLDSINCIKTKQNQIFMINRKGNIIWADKAINLKVNAPELIFVIGNFINHSLFASYQQKILNFFPLPKDSNNIVHHTFKNPIIHKMVPGSVFHIKLVDEKFREIKADVGTATLLVLKKSSEENMFPVTLISSDLRNLELFPDNTTNSFKNKLSFPLLFNKETKWGVSLRSMVYPKVKNIFSEYFSFTIKNMDSQSRYYNSTLTISLDDSYVSSLTKLIILLNQKISSLLLTEMERPTFSRINGFVKLKTKGYECYFNKEMLKVLGFTHSYRSEGLTYQPHKSITGVLEANLFLLQPQEMLIISNIVEEAFYAQSRPKILKIVPITSNQTEFNSYNYIQFDDKDFIPIKLDRIDDIQILILRRNGDFIKFINQQDVKCQLEFKQLS